MSTDKTYAERLKRMKESIEKNKEILDGHFPDDVTTIGSPDLIRSNDESDSNQNSEETSNEKAGSKKSE
jgi:hypothetical protein